MRLHPRCGFPARAASRKARPLAERCLSKSRYRTPVEVLEPGIAERRERSPACAHGEINNKKSDTPGRGRPSPVARLARLLGRPRRPAVIVDCACRPRAFVHREGSQSVSQSVISRTHPALTPPPALNPAPMEGSTRLSVNDLETITQDRGRDPRLRLLGSGASYRALAWRDKGYRKPYLRCGDPSSRVTAGAARAAQEGARAPRVRGP